MFGWHSNAQTFIPNFSFEEWESIDTGKFIKPKNWHLEYAPQLLASGDTPRVQRSNDAKNGTYSLMITTAPDSAGIAVGETLILPFNFKGKPTELKGFYKLTGTAFTINLEFLVKDTNGNWVMSASSSTQLGASATWAEWSLPINYIINQTAQRCSLTVSFPAVAVPKNGESLWLDALSFSNKSLGVDVMKSLETAVYPNPAKDFLTIENTSGIAVVTGMDGRSEQREIVNGRIDVAHFCSGLYIVTCGVNNYKFIKE